MKNSIEKNNLGNEPNDESVQGPILVQDENGFTINADNTVSFPTFESYKAWRVWFDKFNFKARIKDSGKGAWHCCVDEEGIETLSFQDLLLRYEHVYKAFLQEYRYDPTVPFYRGIAFVPPTKDPQNRDKLKLGYYNWWKDFAWEKHVPAVEVAMENLESTAGVIFFKCLVNHMACFLQKEAHTLMTWIADIIQNPGMKGEVCLVITGGQGIGKTTFQRVINRLLLNKVFETGKAKEHFFCRFNDGTVDKLLVTLCESKSGDNFEFATLLKQLITDKTISVEKKHGAKYNTNTYYRLLLLANEFNVVRVEHDDRRFFVLTPVERDFFEVGDEVIPSETFFTDINQKVLPNDDQMSYIFQYLKHYKYDEGWYRAIPITKEKKDLKRIQMSGVEAFFYDLVLVKHRHDEVQVLDVPNEVLEAQYREFCDANDYEKKKAFHRDIMNLAGKKKTREFMRVHQIKQTKTKKDGSTKECWIKLKEIKLKLAREYLLDTYGEEECDIEPRTISHTNPTLTANTTPHARLTMDDFRVMEDEDEVQDNAWSQLDPVPKEAPIVVSDAIDPKDNQPEETVHENQNN